MIDRMDRISKLLKREVAIILQEEANDPRIKDITIMRVEVARDMRSAWVYYDASFYGEEEKKEIRKGLKRAGSFVRGEVAKRMSLKFTPRFFFREDKEEERRKTIDSVFDKIEDELGITKDHDAEGRDNE